MNKMTLTENSKKYMNSRVFAYETGKLSGEDERQLFQDLVDSGYIANFPKYQDLVNRLVKTGLVSTKNNDLN